jgi:hypothetical protein
MKTGTTQTVQTGAHMRAALIVGLAAAAAAVVGLFTNGPQLFFQAYLFGFLFWIGTSLGCLALLLLYYLTGSRWGLTIRRITEAGAGTLWLMALFFLPMLLALPILFPWARPALVAAQPILQAKSVYLNAPFFILRAAIYFLVWIVLANSANRHSAQLADNASGDAGLRGRLQGLGAAGLIAYALTMTFASVDWLMSLEPFWSSTIFGLVIIVGQVLTAMSFAILVLNLFPSLGLGRDWTYQTTPIPYQDLGALTITMVMGWAYLAYFQMLIIWAGNLPREVVWYTARIQGGWSYVAIFIAAAQFIIPFIILLSIRARHNLRRLAILGGLLLFSNLVNTFWHVKPAFYPGQFAISWLDLVIPAAMGGLWMAVFLYNLQRRPALNAEEQVLLQPAGERSQEPAEGAD